LAYFSLGRKFLSRIKRGGKVLDLGCGAGYPVARGLADRGFRVTGIDISRRMLARARKAVPEGTFLHRDMANPGLPARAFDGAVAMHSLFHVSWRVQPKVFRAVRLILRPGAPFLFNLGIERDREYTDEYMGTRMYWSSLTKAENLRMLDDSGFRVLAHGSFIVGKERHYYFLAVRK